MPPPRVERLLTAIDVGSSKVAVIIAGQTADGSLHTLGSGFRESLGVKRGCVVDVAAVDRSVREALEQAERVAGVEVQHAWVGFGGGSLTSSVETYEIPFNGEQIESDDVDELLSRAADHVLHSRRTILHAQPTLFTLDGNSGIKNPVGLFADRFGVSIHMVEADRGPVNNLVTAVRAAHVDIREVVATMMAAGLSSLTEEQRDLGTALVDIGASLTNIGVFVGGMLCGVATLAAGGNDITDDIASAFGTKRSKAEWLKCYYGSAISSPRDHQDRIDLADDDEPESERPKITRAQLNAVIRKRLDHFVPQIGKHLASLGDGAPSGREVVLIGGGTELKGMADYVQGVLGGSARVARPKGILSLPDAHAGPAFATVAGLIRYAAAPPSDLRPRAGEAAPSEGAQSWVQRLLVMWRRTK